MKTLIKLTVIISVAVFLFIKIYVPLMSEKSNEQITHTKIQNLKENSEPKKKVAAK